MGFREPPFCAAVRTLTLCSRNIQGEYLAQFTRASIAIEIIIGA
jgi:hypothetical protein